MELLSYKTRFDALNVGDVFYDRDVEYVKSEFGYNRYGLAYNALIIHDDGTIFVRKYFKDDAIVEVRAKEPEKPKDDKHMKGYIYDSLVFRYMRAREAQAELEARHDAAYHPERGRYDEQLEKKKEEAWRDEARFMDILNEAIGEHD